MKQILLLEDDENLNHGIAFKLEKEGYHVLPAFGVSEAERLFAANQVDLIISDITLNDGNGLDFCAGIRKRSNVYIIFLTAMDTEIDMVLAYDIGADDYVTKPFSLMVLVSKVHACMRRMEDVPKTRISSASVMVSYEEMKAFRIGEQGPEELALSKKELQLLMYFMEHAGKIVSKEQILEHIWDVDGQFVDDNTVPVNISRLKGKLGIDVIRNVRGMGYIWTEENIRE
ncbi:MAG: response regulator transcription factor [Lachnospiraceae bacterium]|nr:response regulator transcription factor [Lachnospiraceae bacterium]